MYAAKREALEQLEGVSQQGAIDIFYGDESGVCLQPCVPYAWQFTDEVVTLPSERGGHMNCFALLARDNRCFSATTEGKVNAAWIAEQIGRFSASLIRLTVVVLDNASVHTKAVKDNAAAWEERGLFVLFLPTYSPHLNIAEILWRKLKYEWLQPRDYADKETLHTAVRDQLGQVGKERQIAFQPFRKTNLI